MKRIRMIVVVIVGVLLLSTVGVLAVSKSQIPQVTTIKDPTLTLTKAYDGTTKSDLTPGELSGIQGVEGIILPQGVLTGIFGLDDVKVSAIASYDTAAVGTAKTITVVYTLEGKDAVKYVKPVDFTAVTGEITPIQLTIGEPTLILSKEIDGTTTANVTPGLLTGIIGTDDVTVSAIATYDTPDVGTDKSITVTYTLGGASAANYITPIAYTVPTGVITTPPVVVTSSGATSGGSTSSGSTSSGSTSSTSYSAPAAVPVPNVVSSATVAP